MVDIIRQLNNNNNNIFNANKNNKFIWRKNC